MALDTLAEVAIASAKNGTNLSPFFIAGKFMHINGQIEIKCNEPIIVRVGSNEENHNFTGLIAVSVVHTSEEYSDIPLKNEYDEAIFSIDGRGIKQHDGYLRVPNLKNLHFGVILECKNQDPVFTIMFNILSTNAINSGHLKKGKLWTLTLFDPSTKLGMNKTLFTLPVQCTAELRAITRKKAKRGASVATSVPSGVSTVNIASLNKEEILSQLCENVKRTCEKMSIEEVQNKYFHSLFLFPEKLNE